MSELGDLLETLHDAGRFRTARAVFRIWNHRERAFVAFREDAAESGATMYAAVDVGDERAEHEEESEVRLWLDVAGDRARIERDDDHIAVKDGQSWWTWHRDYGASTNVGSDREVQHSVGEEFLPLLNPAALMGALEWTPAGRDGDQIHATAQPRRAARRQDEMLTWGLHAFGGGADEYAFVLDAGSGAVRRVEARHQGRPFHVIEAVELAFDETLPDETFVFEAPEGEDVRPVDDWSPGFGLPIHEIVERASFTVLVPDEVPSTWTIESHYMPARDRPPMPESITLFYRSRDATGGLTVSQSHPGDDFNAGLLSGQGWQQMERDGVRFRMRERTPNWRQPQLYIEREGTAAMLTSDSLSNDDLIELALSLRPASGDSPLADS